MKTNIKTYFFFLLTILISSCGSDSDEEIAPEDGVDYFEFKLNGEKHSFEFPTFSIVGAYTNHPSGKKYTVFPFSDSPVNELVAVIGTAETSRGTYTIEPPENGETVTTISIFLNKGTPMALTSQSGTLKLTEFTQYDYPATSGGYVDAVGEFSGTFEDDNGNTHTITEGKFRSKESNPFTN